MSESGFARDRFKSVGYALKGAWVLLSSEGSIQVQFVIALLVTGAGWYFGISATEWMFQLLAIGMVMGLEGVNTAVEKLSDYVQPNSDPRIGELKDVSAGAVLLASIIACIIGGIIYAPRIF
ncbi:MAG: diacylglycerol kinase family protein [Robiginitalea sp.]|jgi:diacylglycerol kinase